MHIIVIGATAAGTSVAAKARRLLKNKKDKITIYEKGDITGFGACGLPFFVGNFFESTDEMIARTPEEFRKSGIEVKLRHEVINVDPDRQIITIRNIDTQMEITDQYDKLMIATGAEPILPPFAIPLPQGAFLLRTMSDGIALRKAMNKKSMKKIVVIGAGYIGIEVVVAAHHLNKKVTVVEMRDRVMSTSFDSEFSEIITKELIEQHIDLKLSCTVQALIGDPVQKVLTNQGEIYCDSVVLSAGVRPATQFLKGIKFQMLKNGALIVDNKGQTNIKNIYAGGDCATILHLLKKDPVYIPLATVANKLGRIIGENIAGYDTKMPAMIGAASLKIIELEAARVGLTEQEAKDEGYDIETALIQDLDHSTYHPPTYPMHIKLIYEKGSQIILGGQVIGKMGAALRSHALSVAIVKRMTTRELGLLDFAYSPAFTRPWDILNIAGNVANAKSTFNIDNKYI